MFVQIGETRSLYKISNISPNDITKSSSSVPTNCQIQWMSAPMGRGMLPKLSQVFQALGQYSSIG